MDSLPPELLSRIASFLPSTADLISMRLVNRQYAAIAFRPLFGLLRFSGRRQDEAPPWNFGPAPEAALPRGHVGRTRTVEFGKLPEVVDEILGSSLARYTKTFIFEPAYYRERFWQDYLIQLENEMHEPVDEVEFGPDDDSDGDDWEAAIERVLEHRRTRPEREANIIDAAQTTWNEKIAEQKLNEEAVAVALTRLFQAMKFLKKIEIRPWEFDGRLLFPGLESCVSYGIDVQRRGSFPSTRFLEIIAQALHAADRRIKHLNISEFFADHLHDSSATRHLFTGLQHIRMDVIHVEFLADEARKAQVLVDLFKCAQPTLQRLSIVAGGDGADEAGETPLVFPQLEFVRLGGLILSTPPLVRFLRAQPNLKRLEFSNIYLSTPDAGWPSLVEALPTSVESWKVSGPLGHEPVNADGPTAYNWMTTWIPQELPPTSGWKAIPRKYGTYFARAS
ncbi:hypothetical protein E0Z10_g4386 [Xylaria hypoxylon]|uniref:F-box domain-containing protein n=1 Tax=Xylaria hypoxylon TaxID=37992 RepID=A0A4Z0Z444_9PEZI|nr:hypothetical protein E0Z10_g4386 [Xylaria hypoxylon]